MAGSFFSLPALKVPLSLDGLGAVPGGAEERLPCSTSFCSIPGLGRQGDAAALPARSSMNDDGWPLPAVRPTTFCPREENAWRVQALTFKDCPNVYCSYLKQGLQ